ncbi:hypothetical protein ACQCSU_21665 (plasmid) [Pseudarthrobacter sp. O4]|uniref:hypothetical protein n=1 Tax=Pseudarthrobacter sp. O4 TaxID=3418417 RepID=UPI003CF65EAB
MAFDFDRPPRHPDALPDKPWQTPTTRYVNPMFQEESFALTSDWTMHADDTVSGQLHRFSDEDQDLAYELEREMYRYGLGWMMGPDRRLITVIGPESCRAGEPVPERLFPHLTAKVACRATAFLNQQALNQPRRESS